MMEGWILGLETLYLFVVTIAPTSACVFIRTNVLSALTERGEFI